MNPSCVVVFNRIMFLIIVVINLIDNRQAFFSQETLWEIRDSGIAQ